MLDPTTYDYAATVLFNNHAGQLWQRFTTRLRRELATIARDIQLNRETAREALAYNEGG